MIDLNGKEVAIAAPEEVYKRKKVSLFDWLNALGTDKNYLLDDNNQPDFVPFMINRGMSQNIDTVMYANEMNKHWQVSKEMVYDFYHHSVSKKKRYTKWAKQTGDQKEEIDLLINHYNINRTRAIEYLKVLTSDDIKLIKDMYEEGGK